MMGQEVYSPNINPLDWSEITPVQPDLLGGREPPRPGWMWTSRGAWLHLGILLRDPCSGQGTGLDVYELPSCFRTDPVTESPSRGSTAGLGKEAQGEGAGRSFSEQSSQWSFVFHFLLDEKQNALFVCRQRTNRVLTCILHN